MYPLRVLSHERSASLMRGVTPAGDALRRFGEELARQGAAQIGGSFTGLRDADALIRTSPEAFLLGVLFTQGIPAERAWAAPYLLRQRLGHLDVQKLARDTGEVAAALVMPPALHRFVHTVPGWIVDAARRLIAEYGGSAAAIWPPGSHVLDVTRRLLAFQGIGEKKAAMTVEILMRHFSVPLAGAEFGNVAYDVHVRRVFLRAGLVAEDSATAVRDAAQAACPASPGTLDLAAWLVGRQWCRPSDPRCDECRLGAVCLRLTSLGVKGVGIAGRAPMSAPVLLEGPEEEP
ncbi:MAG: HhH-GDP family DNA glycosylase [Coriobacteriia bacterium]